MYEINDGTNEIKTKSKTDLIVEVSQLTEELRARMKKTRSDKSYSRYVGMLTTLYGILLKAASGDIIEDQDREEISKAMSELVEKIPRRVLKIVQRNGVVRYAAYYK